jgi:hypothetical protein
VLLTPSFKDYLDYFYNFDPVWDALVEIIVFLGVLVATIVYSVYLEDSETRVLIRFALLFYLINTSFNMLLVKGITLGLSNF